MALSNKRRVFIEEYLTDFNATQAAIRAGYSEKTARSQGQRLLTNVDVQEAIEQRMDELSMSANEAMLLLTKLAQAKIGDYIDKAGVIDFEKVKANSYPIHDITHDIGKRSKISIEGRLKALETILKVRGKFVHRVVLEGIERLEIELPVRPTVNDAD